MRKFLTAATLGVAAFVVIASTARPASAAQEAGYWAAKAFDDACYDPCPWHLFFCTCYVLPDIIIH